MIFRARENWVGLVVGDSHSPGTVRVHWKEPTNQIGIHQVSDLVVDDAPPSQEDLAALM